MVNELRKQKRKKNLLDLKNKIKNHNKISGKYAEGKIIVLNDHSERTEMNESMRQNETKQNKKNPKQTPSPVDGNKL